jgi:hypothetical protein
MDTVSNGGFLQFSAGSILSPLPGDLRRDYGPCDYDIRNNLNAQYVYELPSKFKNRSCHKNVILIVTNRGKTPA